MKHGGGSITLRIAGDAFYITKLVRVEGETLEGNLFQSEKDLRLGWRFIFKQDDVPKHTASVTLEGFKTKNPIVSEWPTSKVRRQSG